MSSSKKYDLEDRTLRFAKRVRSFIRKVPKDICNIEDSRQLAKASGSIGANYREANEALSKKDFKMRIKISRKEAKESRFWLHLIDIRSDKNLEREREALIQSLLNYLKYSPQF